MSETLSSVTTASWLGHRLGARLVLRQPSAWLTTVLAGALLGLCRGLSRQTQVASAGFYSEVLVATVLTASWLIALRLAPSVRAPGQSLLGAFPGGVPPVHPRWVVGGAAGGICLSLLPATAFMVVIGLLVEPGQWQAISPLILPVTLLAWMGGCSIALWVLILSGSLGRSLVLLFTLLILLVDLAPPAEGASFALRMAFFPVSPASLRVDDWVGPGTPARWLAASVCHVLGLWVTLLLMTPLRSPIRS